MSWEVTPTERSCAFLSPFPNFFSVNVNLTTPAIDTTPRVPANIAEARIANFMSKDGIFHSMGIYRGVWSLRHSGTPHVALSVYSVPDLKVCVY